MITDAIMSLVFLPFTFLLNAIPTVTWPDWLASSGAGTVGEKMQTWGSYVGTLGGWFPVSAFFDSLTVVAVCALAGIAIKFIRLLISLFTGGGGSAA